jgi:hypothetical protein
MKPTDKQIEEFTHDEPLPSGDVRKGVDKLANYVGQFLKDNALQPEEAVLNVPDEQAPGGEYRFIPGVTSVSGVDVERKRGGGWNLRKRSDDETTEARDDEAILRENVGPPSAAATSTQPPAVPPSEQPKKK